eukprot:TRINITY_DN7168_c0_g1_i4.p3 TRINITY_DN7168_c0_g1~~TRINITY_DN7168_c0_g1_i4.p3  ORF type:complete len:101 (+),score=21.32 TRINITY_DN7168_c0_g1_i4:31-333(+)
MRLLVDLDKLFNVQYFFFFFQAEDGIRDHAQSRGLGDVYKRQYQRRVHGTNKSQLISFNFIYYILNTRIYSRIFLIIFSISIILSIKLFFSFFSFFFYKL